MSANRSTYFEWYRHPSSAAHITVSTVSDITETAIATCRELTTGSSSGLNTVDTVI